VRTEDQLVVWKVDRLGRSLREMVNTAHELQQQGVKIRSLTENVDSETPTGRLMFNLLATIAEYFLDLSRERTVEAEGRLGPRPQGRPAPQALRRRPSRGPGHAEGPDHPVARRLAVSRTTFYAYFPGARTRTNQESRP
jgi:DNA invertase Pin-like site-specific DNA recombinase